MGAAKVMPWVLRLALAGLFVAAGALKVPDPWAFATEVHNYKLTPWDVSVVTAFYLPWLEIFAGLALLVRRWQPGALAALAGMTLVFTVALALAWYRGLDISCGCFGKAAPGEKANYPLLLARDVAMLAGIAYLAALRWKENRTAKQGPAPGCRGD